MNKSDKLIFALLPTDFIVILFCVFLSILNIIFASRIDTWYLNVLMNLIIVFFIFFIISQELKSKNVIWKQIRYWYLVPLILLFFKELYLMVDPIRGIIIDDLLIKTDRLIFGFDPTHMLFKITNPYLTELLQIIYGTFFFLPVILGIDLIFSNKSNALNYSAFIIVFGFILSFVGYILFPAIGPRFTLHDFALNNFEMPGLFITDFLREVVNSGESIPAGTLNPELVVQRDAFPSGHTQMTLLVIYLSLKFNAKTKYFFLPVGTLLIFSTVYLRYHYVADLIGGIIFMFFTLWCGDFVFNWWENIRTKNVKYNKV